MRWTADLEIPLSGKYTFRTRTDDGVLLYVNGVEMSKSWRIKDAVEQGNSIELTGGEFASIKMLYFATGGNAEASRLIGLPVERVQIILYIVSGISGAVAGAMLAAQLGAAAPGAASTHLLTVIAAIILGGTSLYGGRGSVWGTLLAVLILGTLANGLTLMDVSSFWQDVTRGVVLMLAVSLDAIRTRALGE